MSPTSPVPESVDRARLYYATRSLCPTCGELVPGRIVPRGAAVLLERSCPAHGTFEAVICSDRSWYERLPLFAVDPVRPRSPRSRPVKGCPEDCGLCSAHLQGAATAAVEISNHCDARCPACLADNQGTFELSPEEVMSAVRAILANQDRVDVVTLSGGEPTLHPRLFDILEALQIPEIGRIAVNSNGLRIASDDAFVERLARSPRTYVCLHYDGSGARALRGVDPAVQERAVERLDRRGVEMAPVVLAAKGVNDAELGPIAERLFLERPSVKGLLITLLTHTGRGANLQVDPMARLTIPEALDQIESGTAGRIRKTDFIPLPSPNPLCAAVGYFLLMDGELTPLIGLGELGDVVGHVKGGHFGALSPQLGDFLRSAIDRLWSGGGDDGQAKRLLGKLRRLLELLFPEGGLSPEERERRAARHLRVIYLMQLMDRWTFDARRFSRCTCQHALPNGSIFPSCAYYTLHRRFDPRFAGGPS